MKTIKIKRIHSKKLKPYKIDKKAIEKYNKADIKLCWEIRNEP